MAPTSQKPNVRPVSFVFHDMTVAGSVITLRDEKGNQLYEPIVQTYFGAPRPAGG